MIRFLFLILLTSCTAVPQTHSYQKQYAHLHGKHVRCNKMKPSDFFIVFLVDARRMDYTNCTTLMSSLVRHPSDGSKNGDFGHAWIYMEGNLSGKRVYLEGGHTGAYGIVQPNYFDGMQMLIERCDPNPVSYLWKEHSDGHFENGSGGHTPTYAIKIDLTEEQFLDLIDWLHPQNYPHNNYSIQGTQCASVLAEIGERIGLHFSSNRTIHIPPKLMTRCGYIPLRESEEYEFLSFSSPDRLEEHFMELVCKGEAEYARDWYLSQKLPKKQKPLDEWKHIPHRLKKLWLFY